ncbi:putative peptidylprolyl isomerase [Helianthus annuus]|nr:putative peptidylprolyl isomerase [Helianthus annuus]
MEKIKEYNKKDAKFYGNMFAKMTKSSSNKAKEAEPMTRFIFSKVYLTIRIDP